MDRINILLVVFDSLSKADLLASLDQLPSLKASQESSLWFTNAYATSPAAGPARASLFTGLDFAAHGVWTDGVTLPTRETPFPERFALNGYSTWLAGQRYLAGAANWTTEHARPTEFAHFDWAHGPLHRSRQNTYHEWLQRAAPEAYRQIFPHQPNADDTAIPAPHRAAMSALPDKLSFNSWVGKIVEKRLNEAGDARPFLGVAGFVVGATQGAGPEADNIVDKLVPNALQQADAAIGGIIETLKANRQAEKTVLVITSARGSAKYGHPIATMHNTALNVPLMIVGPKITHSQIEGIVSTMDIVPTLYEQAAIVPPQRLQGQSLISASPRGWALSRLRHPDHEAQTCLLMTEEQSSQDRLLKLIATHKNGEQAFALYDLRADPSEEKNLARESAFSEQLEVMVDQMIDARVALEDRTEPRVAMF